MSVANKSASKIGPRNSIEHLYFWSFFIALSLFLFNIFDRDHTAFSAVFCFMMYLGKRFESPYLSGARFQSPISAVPFAIMVVALIALLGFFFGNW
jgi:hypothetical protein